MKRRALLIGSAAAAACTLPFAWAQQSAVDRWRLLVNEAVTADLSIPMLAMRYRGWAEYLGSQIRNRQVLVDPIIDIPRFVQQALGDQKPLLIFGKSVNQLAKLVRDHGYQPLVRRPEPYQAAFIVPKDSPIRDMTQLAGHKLLLPDAYSATAAVARAEIRRINIREPFMSHTRFQDSVAIQVSSGIAEAGVVNPPIARKWRESGGRVIGETQPVVNWSVLAAPKVPADVVARLTESLVGMTASATGPLLADIGVKQWVKADRKDYVALLEYTGE